MREFAMSEKTVNVAKKFTGAAQRRLAFRQETRQHAFDQRGGDGSLFVLRYAMS